MTEHIDQIITLSDETHFFLQSIYNETDPEGAPIAGNSYYVGYPCADAEDATPLPGHQPGQVYLTPSVADLDGAATYLSPVF